MFKKSAGNSHVYTFTNRSKSSWGANGIIPSLLKAMKVIFRCISGICLMSKTKGFEVLRAGFFGCLILTSEARFPKELSST